VPGEEQGHPQVPGRCVEQRSHSTTRGKQLPAPLRLQPCVSLAPGFTAPSPQPTTTPTPTTTTTNTHRHLRVRVGPARQGGVSSSTRNAGPCCREAKPCAAAHWPLAATAASSRRAVAVAVGTCGDVNHPIHGPTLSGTHAHALRALTQHCFTPNARDHQGGCGVHAFITAGVPLCRECGTVPAAGWLAA
jgi:hypothetical protein